MSLTAYIPAIHRLAEQHHSKTAWPEGGLRSETSFRRHHPPSWVHTEHCPSWPEVTKIDLAATALRMWSHGLQHCRPFQATNLVQGDVCASHSETGFSGRRPPWGDKSWISKIWEVRQQRQMCEVFIVSHQMHHCGSGRWRDKKKRCCHITGQAGHTAPSVNYRKNAVPFTRLRHNEMNRAVFGADG